MTEIQKENKSVRKVPNLRFPGFEGEWETKKLGEIAEKVNTKNKTNEVNLVFSNSAVQGIVLQNDYFDKNIANKDNLTEYYIVKPFDFVYNPRISSNAKVGAMSVNKTRKTGVVSPLYTVFKINSNLISNSFLEIMFKSNVWHNYMRSIANYGARDDRMNIKSDDFFALSIKAPSNKEQSKIAIFLTLIDSRITIQNKIIENLKTQMLGLQEKIFRQKIKLKDTNGKFFPLWSFKKGGELFESISNKNHNSDLPILAITQDKGAVPRDLIDYQITVTEKSIESYKVVEIGDFIISLRSFQGGIEHSDYKGICSPAYIILRNKFEIVHNFYRYYFKTLDYIKLLNRKLEGIRDGKMVSYSYFAEIELPFPIIEEQKKIATFLSKIDQKIQTEEVILEQLEMQKKYLLHQMFV